MQDIGLFTSATSYQTGCPEMSRVDPDHPAAGEIGRLLRWTLLRTRKFEERRIGWVRVGIRDVIWRGGAGEHLPPDF